MRGNFGLWIRSQRKEYVTSGTKKHLIFHQPVGSLPRVGPSNPSIFALIEMSQQMKRLRPLFRMFCVNIRAFVEGAGVTVRLLHKGLAYTKGLR